MALRILHALCLLWLLSFQGACSLSFHLQHRYSELEGSSKRGGMSSEHFRRLQHHDTKRHTRNLVGSALFPVGGSFDPNVAGLYFTELNIGTPPSSYFVQVDTGSDLLWLSCITCMTCPTSTNLGVPLKYYDPYSSPTSQQIGCNEQYCASASNTCLPGGTCAFQLVYGDGTTITCFIVQDVLELPIVGANHSDRAAATFGCTTDVSGGAQQSNLGLDGILGLGQSNMSIIQQLAFQGKTPRIFSHCLEGERRGGGILVIGDLMEPGLVYTPLMSNQLHYTVNLKSIEVNGQFLKVDSSINATGENQGTIIDSGTTLAYIVEPAYQLLLQEIQNSGPSNLERVTWKDLTCFLYDHSLDNVFPTVTFTFENGATMQVPPHDYFFQLQTTTDSVFCIGFQRSLRPSPDLTILGDLVLKNKLVVYDLEKQQIGWVDYNCSSNVTILSSTGQPMQVLGSLIGNPTSAAHGLRVGMGFAFLFLVYITVRL